MLSLQEIAAIRDYLTRVGDPDRAVRGKIDAFNLVGCFQSLDREERAALIANQDRSKDELRKQVQAEIAAESAAAAKAAEAAAALSIPNTEANADLIRELVDPSELPD